MFYTVNEFAKLVGMHPQSIRNAISLGRISKDAVVRVGGSIRIDGSRYGKEK